MRFKFIGLSTEPTLSATLIHYLQQLYFKSGILRLQKDLDITHSHLTGSKYFFSKTTAYGHFHVKPSMRELSSLIEDKQYRECSMFRNSQPKIRAELTFERVEPLVSVWAKLQFSEIHGD